MKFNLTAHKALWNWLAENPEKKKDWPGWEENGGKVKSIAEDSYCFACHYASYVPYSECEEACPLQWGAPLYKCTHYDGHGLYDLWCKAHGEKKKEYAKRIRDLHVREGVEYE